MRKLLMLLSIAASAATSSLMEAVKHGDTAAVASMLKHGADVNKPEPDGTTALHWAAHRNDLKMAELLIRAGAKADVVNDYGVTAISEAAGAGSAAIVELL